MAKSLYFLFLLGCAVSFLRMLTSRVLLLHCEPGAAMSTSAFGLNQSAKKGIDRKEKQKQKSLPIPRQWKNSARTNPDAFSSEKWKALGHAGQVQYTLGCRPKPHKYLGLCYPLRFPPDFSYAWDSLTEDGTIVL